MTFLATQSPPATADEGPLENDGWFPDIDMQALRKTARLDGTVTPERLRHASQMAVMSVNSELGSWADLQRQAGHASLLDVPATQLGQKSWLELCYLRAVYSAVQADLVEAYRNQDTTGAGDKKADAMEPKADEYRRNMRWAISDMLGIRRTTVELI